MARRLADVYRELHAASRTVRVAAKAAQES